MGSWGRGLVCWVALSCVGLGAPPPIDAQGLTVLTDLQDRYPTWDARREQVWFYSNRTGVEQLWSIRPDGSSPQLFGDGDRREVVPSVGPDGRVVFVRYEGENEEIYLLDPETGTRTPVAPHPAADSDPSWDADGRRIWFASNREGNWSIWSVASSGGEPRRETDAPQRDAFPRVSPDGRWLAFQRTMARTDAEIFLRNLDTGEERNVSNWSGGWDGWPSWAPDSRSILFASNRGGDSQLWSVGLAEGDSARAVTAIPGFRVRRAHWLPDGRSILTNIERPNDPTVWAVVLGEDVLLQTAEEAGRQASARDGFDPAPLVDPAEAFARDGGVARIELHVEEAGDVLAHRMFGVAHAVRGDTLERGRLHNLRSMTTPTGGSLAQIRIDRALLSTEHRVAKGQRSARGPRTRSISVEQVLTPRGQAVQGGIERTVRDQWVELLEARRPDSSEVIDGTPRAPERDFAPVVSPDGRKVVFYSYRDDPTPDLYLLDLDSGAEARLTSTPTTWEIEPDWFGDSERIVFAAGPSMQALDVHVMNVETGALSLFNPDHAGAGPANAAPDGRRLVTTTRSASGEERFAWLSREDGLIPIDARLPPGRNASPRPSPDGTHLLFHNTLDGRRDLYVLALATGEYWCVTESAVEEEYLRWSADGRWLLFSAEAGELPPRIYGVPVDLPDRRMDEPRKLSKGSSDEAHAFSSVSADGRWLYYDATLGEDSRIFRQSLTDASASPERLTGGAP